MQWFDAMIKAWQASRNTTIWLVWIHSAFASPQERRLKTRGKSRGLNLQSNYVPRCWVGRALWPVVIHPPWSLGRRAGGRLFINIFSTSLALSERSDAEFERNWRSDAALKCWRLVWFLVDPWGWAQAVFCWGAKGVPIVRFTIGVLWI